MGLFLNNGELNVNISNETMLDFRGRILLTLRKADLTILDSMEADVTVKSLKSRDVITYEVMAEDPYDTFLAVDLLDEKGNFIMRQVELLVPDKHFSYLKPSFQIGCVKADGGVAIDVTSDVLAKGVCIDFKNFDLVLSDNFFALTDGKPYRVMARTDRTPEEILENLTIQSVYDIR